MSSYVDINKTHELIHVKLTHVAWNKVDLVGYCGEFLHDFLEVSVVVCHLLGTGLVVNVHGHVSNIPRHQHQVHPAGKQTTEVLPSSQAAFVLSCQKLDSGEIVE